MRQRQRQEQQFTSELLRQRLCFRGPVEQECPWAAKDFSRGYGGCSQLFFGFDTTRRAKGLMQITSNPIPCQIKGGASVPVGREVDKSLKLRFLWGS
jgi:hypothetical protein